MSQFFALRSLLNLASLLGELKAPGTPSIQQLNPA